MGAGTKPQGNTNGSSCQCNEIKSGWARSLRDAETSAFTGSLLKLTDLYADLVFEDSSCVNQRYENYGCIFMEFCVDLK
jgi:hypothetical protein